MPKPFDMSYIELFEREYETNLKEYRKFIHKFSMASLEGIAMKTTSLSQTIVFSFSLGLIAGRQGWSEEELIHAIEEMVKEK